MTAIDLMKNLILARAERSGMTCDDCFEDWQTLLGYLTDDYSTQERFFRQYYNAFKNRLNEPFKTDGQRKKDPLGYIATRSNLLSIFEELISRDLSGFMSDILVCGEIYSRLMPVLRKKSPNTVEAYRYTLNIYLVFLCEKHSKSLYNITVKDFSQKNILFFLDWLIEERGNKASTANLRLRHIKRFCRFLMDENILMISELSAIQKIAEIPNASEDTIKFLTIQETKLILSQPDTSKAIGIRDSLFMYLLYDSGCRIQEILRLKLKDFFVQNGTAELHIIGKGNKFRITPISEELIPKFERYCRHYHKSSTYDDYLFYTKRRGVCSQMSCDTAQTFIKKYGIMAQKLNSAIPHVHPHLFRHTRAMHLYMAGMPLELVSQWLGHSQLETSLIYARATTDMKRKAVDKISAKENSVFKSDEKFKYADNEDVIRQLYGLM